MKDIGKFTGIPYQFAGNTYESCDCIGLVRLFYEEHGWSPDFHGSFREDWWITEPLRMLRYFCKHLDRTKDVSELTYGDLVYFHIHGEGHCGIYIGYSKILTTFPVVKQWDGSELPSRSFIAHRQLWIAGFVAGFKRRVA